MKPLAALLSFVLFLGCATAQATSPVQSLTYMRFPDAREHLLRAAREAERRIKFIKSCREYFLKLDNWQKKNVNVYPYPLLVTKESSWIARTYCDPKTGTPYIVVKTDYVYWSIRTGNFEHLVLTIVHELAHANTCPSFLKIDREEAEKVAYDSEPVCKLPDPKDEAQRNHLP